MKARKLLCIILSLCLALSVTACGGAPEEEAKPAEPAESKTSEAEPAKPAEDNSGKTLRFSYEQVGTDFNAAQYMNGGETASYAQVYDPLIYQDVNNELHPLIAKEWTVSDDGLDYVFKLDERATFSDGSPITADDVVYSLQAFKDSGAHGWLYVACQEFIAVDPHTVEIKLSEPNVVLLPVLANVQLFCVMSKAAAEKYGDQFGKTLESVVSSGPYKLTEWKPNVSQTFEAREDYFRGAPDIKKIERLQITDINSAVVGIQTGDLDLCFNPVSGTYYEQLKADPNVHLDEYTAARYEYLNFYSKEGLFSDVRMRRAVAMALNKEDALTIGRDGLGKIIRYPGDDPGMNGNPDYSSPYEIKYDPEGAKKLVEECGNVGKEVVIASLSNNPYPELSTLLQSVLTDIGLNARVEIMEKGAMYDAINKEQLQIFFLGAGAQIFEFDMFLPNAGATANQGLSGNFGWYHNPDFDELVTAARRELDYDKRLELYKQMIDIMNQDVILVPVYATEAAIAMRNEVVADNIKSYCFFDYHWAN